MPSITAAQIKAENKWTDADITDTNLEYLIDNVINDVNAETGLSISNLSGSPGSVTVTNAQDYVIKAGVALAVRAYKGKGPTVNLGAVNMQEIVTDPHFKLFSQVYRRGIQRLRGRSFVTT